MPPAPVLLQWLQWSNPASVSPPAALNQNLLYHEPTKKGSFSSQAGFSPHFKAVLKISSIFVSPESILLLCPPSELLLLPVLASAVPKYQRDAVILPYFFPASNPPQTILPADAKTYANFFDRINRRAPHSSFHMSQKCCIHLALQRQLLKTQPRCFRKARTFGRFVQQVHCALSPNFSRTVPPHVQ